MSKNTGKRAALAAETLHQRFNRLLLRGGEDECWPWPGTIMKVGYGQLCWRYERHYAHRLSYEVHHGPIPPGLEVLHGCDNKQCVNPAHLHAGTHADNMREAGERGLMSTEPRLLGVGHPLAKLTEEAVRHIRSSSERGVDLARRYGVYPSLISRVRQGKCWPHVT
jgi:hypothetical protein